MWLGLYVSRDSGTCIVWAGGVGAACVLSVYCRQSNKNAGADKAIMHRRLGHHKNLHSLPEELHLRNFNHADWIQGQSLKRIQILQEQSTSWRVVCIARTPSQREHDNLCDACTKRHLSTNLNCSMTLGRTQTYARYMRGLWDVSVYVAMLTHGACTRLENTFYDFATHQPVPGVWTCVSRKAYPKSRLAYEVYEKTT